MLDLINVVVCMTSPDCEQPSGSGNSRASQETPDMVTLERSLSTATAKSTYPGLIYSSLPRTPHMSNLRESYRASDETKKRSNGAITKITVKREVRGIQLL